MGYLMLKYNHNYILNVPRHFLKIALSVFVRKYAVSMSKQPYFKQFSLAKVQFRSIWPIDRTISDTITLGQSGPGSNGNKGVLCILQSSSITGASLSDYLESYPGHSLGKSYPSAEKQSVCSTAPADWTNIAFEKKKVSYIGLYLWYVFLRNKAHIACPKFKIFSLSLIKQHFKETQWIYIYCNEYLKLLSRHSLLNISTSHINRAIGLMSRVFTNGLRD